MFRANATLFSVFGQNTMGHLIEPIRSVTATECLSKVVQIRAYLMERGREAIRELAQVPQSEHWATDCKRVAIRVAEPKPQGVGVSGEHHNLTEVLNQCANVERLIDALGWALSSESGLAGFSSVVACHPTTSSAKSENDLILKDSLGNKVCFEISDITSDRDSNGKELADLLSLGVLNKNPKDRCNVEWPRARLFLAVSQEFGYRLRRRTPEWVAVGHCHYVEHVSGRTCIFEILGKDIGSRNLVTN